jgi:hypothetical protein
MLSGGGTLRSDEARPTANCLCLWVRAAGGKTADDGSGIADHLHDLICGFDRLC